MAERKPASQEAAAAATGPTQEGLPADVAEGGSEAAQAARPKAAKRKRSEASVARKRRNRQEGATEDVAAASADTAAGDASAGLLMKRGAILEESADDKKGIIHVGTIPAFMGPQKFRAIFEKFGELQRTYLQPEDDWERQKRKRKGGSGKEKFTEGWVEFLDRRLAKKVAASLNGTIIGGKKRNFHRDDMWNMRYLPKFKWTQLKEGKVYNRMVKKARLEQKIGQATRENSLYLERVHEKMVKEKIQERKEAGGAGGAKGSKAPRFPKSSRPARAQPKKVGGISDNVLRSLFACD